jgi:uncharacterized membrane protein YqiK
LFVSIDRKNTALANIPAITAKLDPLEFHNLKKAVNSMQKLFWRVTQSLMAAGLVVSAGAFAANAQTFTNPQTGSSSQPVVVDSGAINWFALGSVGFLLFFGPTCFGFISIKELEVGVVKKKFGGRRLRSSQLVAIQGEAGIQADTLAPGWHFGYFPWQYEVQKNSLVVIPQEQIGLVIAKDGRTIPTERILGKEVECENFQDARAFLANGGEKGRQLSILTTGTYRINLGLFEIVTARNAESYGINSKALEVHRIPDDKVGIVTTLDGDPLEQGDIAGVMVPHHNSFQNAQAFLDHKGQRGLQEQVLLSGSWNLNPWFVNVRSVPMQEVPIGFVGIIISFIGHSSKDITGDSFAHGNLVKKGDRGVWMEPTHPGMHPINNKIMKMELVPTTNIILNFTSRIVDEHGYDRDLQALNLISMDGFSYSMEVFQIIHIGSADAAKVISRLGSMQNLVDQVLRPIVANYFRNSAQEYTVLDFLIDREQRQAEAAAYVREALRAYDVQAVDTLIGQIEPPPELMKTLTDRKMAQELEKTYEAERLAECQRQGLVRETTLANMQRHLVSAEQGVNISKMQADAQAHRATGQASEIQQLATAKADEIRKIGEATAHAYEEGVEALGNQAYAALQMMDRVRDGNIKIVPNVSITGNGGSGGSGVMDSLMGLLVEQKAQQLESQENSESAMLIEESQQAKEQAKSSEIVDVEELFDIFDS